MKTKPTARFGFLDEICTAMRSRFLVFFATTLIIPAFPVRARAQGIRLSPSAVTANGTITVYVRDEFGEPLSLIPQIKLTVVGMGSTPPSPAQTTGDGWVFSDLGPGQEYQVEVNADGYQTAYDTATLPPLDRASANVIVFLKPLGQKNDFRSPGGHYILAPRAAKEVQHGLNDLRSRKLASARKHLERALQMAPGNPYVNYVMGMIYLVSQQAALARPYLEKSVSIDPRQPPSLLALGTARFQTGDYAGASEILEEDVQLDASSWKAQWTLAEAYLRQRNYVKAREYAERALQNGKQNAVRVELLLGQALAGVGEREQAVSTFEHYLRLFPQDPDAAKIRSYVESLKELAPVVVPATAGPAAGAPESPKSRPEASPAAPPSMPITVPPVELPPKENWAPPDIDAAAPYAISGAACSLPNVLRAAGQKADQFVSTLQEFSAMENYQSVEIKRDESLESPQIRKFSYVVTIEDSRPNVIEIHEIRNQGIATSALPGRLADLGAPALALVFHPIYRDDFEWKCEGLGEWNSKPAWLVHFQQRSDRPTSLLAAYETPSQEYALPLKGRAWISQSGAVMHLETDLTHGMTAIDLIRQHFSIDYQPVSFKSHKVQLWLPESVDVYLQYHGHFIHNFHRYSNFKLFWVGTSQKMAKPKVADQNQ